MPPWLSSFRSALRTDRRQRTVQVATASPDAGPTVRSVILRRVEDDGTLIFFTDARSEKAHQLARDDRMEVHAWRRDVRLQFRLRGRARLTTDDADPVRRELWDNLREEDLARFVGPPPGAPVEPGEDRPSTAPEAQDLPEIPAPFAVVRLRPTRVDILSLDPAGHRRERFEQTETGWVRTEIAP